MWAQTNVQLFAELARAGWSIADLQRAEAAYWFAIPKLGSRIRSDGRPFLSHLCGTASLAARAGAGPDTVMAALLHAVFAQGRMARAGGASPANRASVASVAGEDAVSIILAYDAQEWNDTEIRLLAQSPFAIAGLKREALLIRLANEADDAADGAAAFSGKQRYLSRPDLLDGIDRIAAGIGTPSLAAALRHGLAQADGLDLPQSDARKLCKSFSIEPSPPLWLRAARRARKLLAN
ncbi:MAG: hypothetical protein ACRC1J_04095 [Sandaracinobacteroides sp.]